MKKRKNNQRTVSGTVSNDRCDLCGPDHRICPDQFRTDSVSYRRSTDHPARLHSGLQFPDSLWDV